MEPIEETITRLERLNEEARQAGREVRLGLRRLLRAPGFTLIAALTLALGIGANTAIFTWVQAEMLAALPYHDASQLVTVNEVANGRTVSDTYPDFLDWRKDDGRVFAGLAWVQTQDFNLSGAGTPEVASGADVSANYFSLLGVEPQAGRVFEASGDEAVITQGLALRQFGSVAAAVGRRLDLSDAATTVVGVLPAGYEDFNHTDVFVAAERYMQLHPGLNDRGEHGDSVVIGRLRAGVTAAGALAAQQGEMGRLGRTYAQDVNEGAVVEPIRDEFVGQDGPMLWLLLGAVGLVLLIACANVAGLMLVRTASRGQEWGVRMALGASRGRLVRQLMTESLLLAGMGGVAGVGVAEVGLRGLQRLTTAVKLHLNVPVLVFTAGLSGLAAIVFGLAPARQAGRLGTGVRATAGKQSLRMRNALVAGEVALALTLAVAAGLMIKSFSQLMAVNPGFAAGEALTFGTNLAGPRYKSDVTVVAKEEAVLERLQAIPGVRVAALGTNLPLSGNHDRGDVTIAGRPLPERGHFPHPDFHDVSPGYLAAMGVPLLRGRDFNAGDTATSERVVMVSATFARTYWPGEDAIGRQVWEGHPEDHRLLTVVGVVGDTKQYGLGQATRIEIYLPFPQEAPHEPQFVLRAAVAPQPLTGAARQALAATDPTLPMEGVETVKAMMAGSVKNPRATMWMLGIFGGLALGLAMLGIYGVVSYATQQRTRELGIRIALGARPGAIAGLVLATSMRWIGLGLAVGWVGALGAGRIMASQLYGVGAVDPAILAGATVVLFAVGMGASAVPIGRALRVDPQEALRSE